MALAPVMSILHFREIEIFFPVRPLFLQRRGTVADFYPAHGLVVAELSFIHVAEIFAFGNRALAEGFLLDGPKKIVFAAGLDAGSNEITHGRNCWL